MSDQLKASIARIFVSEDENSAIGVGFLASHRYILTCAHVVNDALGLPNSSKMPAQELSLDFPHIAPGKIITAHVVGWDDEDEADIAVLELTASPPATAHPVRLITTPGLWGHTFRAFGFPDGYDQGVWAAGILRDTLANGRVQIEGINIPGHPVVQGFSGTPVWDESLNAVVGMVVESDKQVTLKVAYIIPTSQLLQTWPLLKQSIETQQSTAIRSDFYAHIPLSTNYIERTEVLASTRTELLADIPVLALTSALQYSKPNALHGMGGIGKTVIARALCDDPDIQSAFPDGILWITLGQDPELVSSLRDLINALGGTISESAPSLNRLKNILANSLNNRTCLLILDDVWNSEHVEAFLVGASRCRLLLTTRDAEIANEFSAKILPIPVMTPSEASSLLEEWAGPHLTQIEPLLKDQIVRRLGYLPLAVKLAGAQLRRKSPEEWLETFDIRKLKTLRARKDIHDSLIVTFQLSLDALDEEERTIYTALTIFKEDEATPQVGVERLWQGLAHLNASATEDMLNDLAARALLEIVISPTQTRLISLHDLLRDLIAIEVGDQSSGIHHILLSVYRKTWEGRGWHTARDDGYLYDHLAYHLSACEADNELFALFADQQWLQVRVPQRDYIYDGYLEDLGLAWKTASQQAYQQIEANEEPQSIVNCIRFLLISTSINSLAENYTPELVAWAVQDDLWTAHRALSIARRIPDATKRAKLYIALLACTGIDKVPYAEAQRQGLETALTISSEREKLHTLVELTPHLAHPEQIKVLRKIIQTAFMLADRQEQIWALTQILALTPILDHQERVEVGEAITLQVTSYVFEYCFHITQELTDELIRVETLTILLPHLPEELRARAIEQGMLLITLLVDELEQIKVITILLPYLTEEERTQLLGQYLQITLDLPGQGKRAKCLATLAPYLADDLLERGLEASLKLSDERERTEVLIALAPILSNERRAKILKSCLDATRNVPNEKKRAQILALVAPGLSAGLLRRGLQETQALRSAELRATVLLALAPQLQGDLVNRAFEAALRLSDAHQQMLILVALAPGLNQEQRHEIQTNSLQRISTTSDEYEKVELLVRLAPQVQGDLLTQALKAALCLESEVLRAEGLLALAPWLSGEPLIQAIEATLALSNRPEKVELLAILTHLVSKEACIDIVEQALQLILGLWDEHDQAAITTLPIDEQSTTIVQKAGLIPQLPNGQQSTELQHDLQKALALSDEAEQIVALVSLSASLPDKGYWQQQVLGLVPQLLKDQRAQELPINSQHKERQIQTTIALMPYIAAEQRSKVLQQCLQTALSLADGLEKIEVLEILSTYLTGTQLIRKVGKELPLKQTDQCNQEAGPLETDVTPQNETNAIQRLLYKLAFQNDKQPTREPDAPVSQLSNKLIARTVQFIITPESLARRVQILIAMAPQLTTNLLSQVIPFTLALNDREQRTQMLIALAPQLSGDQLSQVMSFVLTLNNEEQRARVLVALAPRLHGDLLAQALQSINTLKNESYRAQVLMVLIPQLHEDVLAQFFQTTLTSEKENQRSQVLMALTPQLSTELLTQALQATLALENESQRAQILIALAPQLNAGLLSQALQAALALENKEWSALVLMALIPQLDADQLSQTLQAALTLEGEARRTQLLIALAPLLNPDQLSQALQAAGDIKDEVRRSRLLITLAPFLSPDQLSQALYLAMTLETEGQRIYILATLAPFLSADLRSLALKATIDLRNEKRRTQMLITLAPLLDTDQLAQALQASSLLEDEDRRAYMLINLAPLLSTELLTQALQVTRSLKKEGQQARVLMAMAPLLNTEMRSQAMEMINALENEGRRAQVLIALAPQPSAELLTQSLQATSSLENEIRRAQFLIALAPQLHGDLLAQALPPAIALGNEDRRAQVLIALAPQLHGELLVQALQAMKTIENEDRRAQFLIALSPPINENLLSQILQITLALENKKQSAQILTALSPQLNEDLLSQTLRTIYTLGDEGQRAQMIMTLAPQLDRNLLSQALQSAMTLEDEELRSQVIITLAPLLNGDLLSQIVLFALALQKEHLRAQALIAMAPQLHGELLSQVIPSVLTIQKEALRAQVMIAMAPQFDEEQLSQIILFALALQKEGPRSQVLMALAPQFSKDLLSQIVQAAMGLDVEGWRIQAVIALMPQLNEKQLSQIMSFASSLPKEERRAQTLIALAPLLSKDQLIQALQDVLGLQNEEIQRQVVAILISNFIIALLRQIVQMTQPTTDYECLPELVTALALRLPEELDNTLVIQGIHATLELKDEARKAKLLTALLPLAPDPKALRQPHWHAAIDALWSIQSKSRYDILITLFDGNLFNSSVFSTHILGNIASSLLEICQQWHWL